MSGNTGHGHVIPRPDGLRARCGGPGFCKVCQTERAALEMTTNTIPSTASQAASILSHEFTDLMYAWAISKDGTPECAKSWVAIIDHIDAKLEQARNEALSEAMRVCDGIGQDHRDQYKGRGKHAPNNPRRADPHADGCSDGAWECEGAIRELLFTTPPKADESGLPG